MPRLTQQQMISLSNINGFLDDTNGTLNSETAAQLLLSVPYPKLRETANENYWAEKVVKRDDWILFQAFVRTGIAAFPEPGNDNAYCIDHSSFNDSPLALTVRKLFLENTQDAQHKKHQTIIEIIQGHSAKPKNEQSCRGWIAQLSDEQSTLEDPDLHRLYACVTQGLQQRLESRPTQPPRHSNRNSFLHTMSTIQETTPAAIQTPLTKVY